MSQCIESTESMSANHWQIVVAALEALVKPPQTKFDTLDAALDFQVVRFREFCSQNGLNFVETPTTHYSSVDEFTDSIIQTFDILQNILQKKSEDETGLGSKDLDILLTACQFLDGLSLIPQFWHQLKEVRRVHIKLQSQHLLSERESAYSLEDSCNFIHSQLDFGSNLSNVIVQELGLDYMLSLLQILATCHDIVGLEEKSRTYEGYMNEFLHSQTTEQSLTLLFTIIHTLKSSSISNSATAESSTIDAKFFQWVESTCTMLISKTIARPGGVAALFRTLIGDVGSTEMEQQSWRLSQRAAMMVAVPSPTLNLPISSYLSSICPQLVRLLREPPTASSAPLHRACVMTLIQLYKTQESHIVETMMDQLLQPFTPDINTPLIGQRGSIYLTQDVITTSVRAAHLVFVLHGRYGVLMRLLSRYFPQFLQAYLSCFNNKSHLLQSISEILSVFLTTSPMKMSGKYLIEAVNQISLRVDQLEKTRVERIRENFQVLLNDDLPCESDDDATLLPCFHLSDSGSMELRLDSEVSRLNDQQASQLVSFLKTLDRPGLHSQIFLSLLENFIGISNDTAKFENLSFLQLILAFVEECAPDIITDVAQAIECVALMLKASQIDLIVMSLSLLDTLLSGVIPIDRKHWPLLDTLVKPLQQFESHSNSHIASLSQDCATSIVTRHHSWSQHGNQQPSQEESSKEWEEVMALVKDRLMPVRSHGLMKLRKLVLAKDKVALKNLPYVLGLFATSLSDPDSYLYLAAIHGLAALGDVAPIKTIPALVNEFRDESRPIELRMKVGESLMLVARRCGEALPKYLNLMLPAILQGAKDADATMRASCLSNLAQICQQLRFGLHKFLNEILTCVESIARFDPDAQARRGAIHVITLMLRGLGKDALTVLKDHLTKLVNFLRYVEENDEDEVTSFHARLALGELRHLSDEFTRPLLSKRLIID